jgi:hypothetical protein
VASTVASGRLDFTSSTPVERTRFSSARAWVTAEIFSPAEDTAHFATSSTMSTAATSTHGPALRWGDSGGNSRS